MSVVQSLNQQGQRVNELVEHITKFLEDKEKPVSKQLKKLLLGKKGCEFYFRSFYQIVNLLWDKKEYSFEDPLMINIPNNKALLYLPFETLQKLEEDLSSYMQLLVHKGIKKAYFLLDPKLMQRQTVSTRIRFIINFRIRRTIQPSELHPLLLTVSLQPSSLSLKIIDSLSPPQRGWFWNKTALEMLSEKINKIAKEEFPGYRVRMDRPIHLNHGSPNEKICILLLMFYMILLAKGVPRQQVTTVLQTPLRISSSQVEQQQLAQKSKMLGQLQRDISRIPQQLKSYHNIPKNTKSIKKILKKILKKDAYVQGFYEIFTFLHRCGIKDIESVYEWNDKVHLIELFAYNRIPTLSEKEQATFHKLVQDHFGTKLSRLSKFTKDTARDYIINVYQTQDENLKNEIYAGKLTTFFVGAFRLCLKIDQKKLCQIFRTGTSVHHMLNQMLAMIAKKNIPVKNVQDGRSTRSRLQLDITFIEPFESIRTIRSIPSKL